MRRTKIVCTIGPSSDDPRHLLGLVENGMDIARLNMSHGTREEHETRARLVREYGEKCKRLVGVLFDLRGPKIRTGLMKGGKVHLKEGSEITLTTKQVEGTASVIPIDYPTFMKMIGPGQQVFVNDGLIEFKVEEVRGDKARCKVVMGGDLTNRKGVNLPGIEIDLPVISEKDRADIDFAVKTEADFIALSFVRSGSDVLDLRKILENKGSDAWIVSKIENSSALRNIDEIIAASDAIMVARGDLGVQIPSEDIPVVQKSIVAKCNAAAKPVIVATQMLESMVNLPQPTRAEVSDVANAILDGGCALMLSGETAYGKHPVRALQAMDRIIRKAEATLIRYERMKDFDGAHIGMAQSLAKSVCYTARDLRANAIVTYTHRGHTARFISMYRPFTPFIAATSQKRVLMKLAVVWGAQPAFIKEPKTTDELIERCVKCAQERHLVGKGDVVVLAAGIPVQKAGHTNLMKIHEV